MRPAQTVAEVFDAIQQAKLGAIEYLTNFFPVEKRLTEWLTRSELSVITRSGSAFLFRKDRDFQHLYFSAPSRLALQEALRALEELKTEPLVLDIVGKEAALTDLLLCWQGSGFRNYTKLVRLVRLAAIEVEPARTKVRVEFAVAADAAAILQLLEAQFDSYGEQIPLLYELEAAIAAQQILIVRQGRELAGLLFFETQGVSSTLRFWTVGANFQGLGIGSALMRHYFISQTSVKRFGLWVAADNENAVQKYQHYGYKPDGLVDYVLVNSLIRS